MVQLLTNFYNSIKGYVLTALGIIGAIFAVLFMYYKRKSEIEQTELDEAKLNQQLQKQDDQIANNNAALSEEEKKRKELENEQTPTTNIHDITSWFNRKQ